MHYSRKQHWRRAFLTPSPYLKRGLGRGWTLRLKGQFSPISAATSLHILCYLFSL